MQGASKTTLKPIRNVSEPHQRLPDSTAYRMLFFVCFVLFVVKALVVAAVLFVWCLSNMVLAWICERMLLFLLVTCHS